MSIRFLLIFVLFLFGCRTSNRDPLDGFFKELEKKIPESELLQFKQANVFQVIRTDVNYFDTEIQELFLDSVHFTVINSFFDTLYSTVTLDSIKGTLIFMFHDRLNGLPYDMNNMMHRAKLYQNQCSEYWSDFPISRSEVILEHTIISQMGLDTLSSLLPIRNFPRTEYMLVQTIMLSKERISIFSDSFYLFQMKVVKVDTLGNYEVGDTLSVRIPTHRL